MATITSEIEEQVELVDHHDHRESVQVEVIAGLMQARKSLPSKYFYDERGSGLFDEITTLDEYYPTRTERAILDQNIDVLAQSVGKHAVLVEYGSGSSDKTRILLSHLDSLAGYVPVDISREHLRASAAELAALYPSLPILPVHADYTQDYLLPTIPEETQRIAVFFPGSTIGNFRPRNAVSFLKNVASHCGRGGCLIVGVDLKKDPAILEAAYNDSRGVTAAFNKNMLVRINRELGGDFNLAQFEHRAVFNREEGRIEMHLVSRRDQWATVDGISIRFLEGEYIHTENSYKYTVGEFSHLAVQAGFVVSAVWTDPENLFSVQYLTVP